MDRHIDYARLPPRYQKKVVRRTVSLTLLVTIGALSAWKGGPPAWQRVRLLYWQRQAMNYALPANKPVYADGATEVSRLLNQSGYLPRDSTVIWLAKPWEHFYQLLAPPGTFPAATLFLHQRRNGSGQARLIAVEVVGQNNTVGPPGAFLVSICVVGAGSAFARPSEITRDLQLLIQRSTRPGDVCWYAGQPDAADASHFTIKGTLNGKAILVDGWLGNDDRVVLELRNPAANERESIRLTKRP